MQVREVREIDTTCCQGGYEHTAKEHVDAEVMRRMRKNESSASRAEIEFKQYIELLWYSESVIK